MKRGLTLLSLLLSGCALDTNPLVVSLFGPPRVQLTETWAGQRGSATFDHSALGALLAAHVREGWVDYAALAERQEVLDDYLAAVAEAPFDALGRDGKLALLINTYNAATLKLIAERYPLDSIRDIPEAERWDAVRWQVAGQTVSLNQIEHELIRGNFVEPRVHFALVCAAAGCPPLRSEAYTAGELEAQLSDQTRRVHLGARWFRYRPGRASLTRLYQWYRGDFEQVAGSPLAYAARSSRPLAEALARGEQPEITWLPYDWTLNDIKNHPVPPRAGP